MKRQGWIAAACLVSMGYCATADDAPKGDPRAAALLKEASGNRYTWSPEVTTLSGKFTWKKDGKTVEGSFRHAFGKVHALTVNIMTDDAEVKRHLQSHLGSQISHRTPPMVNADRPPVPSVIVVEDDGKGPLIMPIGDALHSTVRVKDGKLVQVNRKMAGRRFTIETTAYEKTPNGKYYPIAFTVTWWDAESGKRIEKQTFTTTGFHKSEGQIFPKAEKIVTEKDDKTSTVEIVYSDVKFETKTEKTGMK